MSDAMKESGTYQMGDANNVQIKLEHNTMEKHVVLIDVLNSKSFRKMVLVKRRLTLFFLHQLVQIIRAMEKINVLNSKSLRRMVLVRNVRIANMFLVMVLSV